MKALKGITLISVCISVLYIALSAILPFFHISFRTRADVFGQVITALVTPSLIVSVLLLRLWKSKHLADCSKLLITLLTILLCGGGAMFALTLISLDREDETMLTENLIVMEKPLSTNDSLFLYYRPTGLIFKKADHLTETDKVDYLREKYQLEFIWDEENNRIYESAHPEITVTVHQMELSFFDDYMEELTFHYLKEGCEVLGLKREYVLHEKGKGWSDNFFYLIGKNLRDVPALSEDMILLADYCVTANGGDSEENIYRRCPGQISYGFRYQGENPQTLYTCSFQFEQLDPEAIQKETLNNYRCELAVWKQARERKARQDQESETALESDDSANREEADESDYREKPAKMIYDAYLSKEGFSYEVNFNAKGNLYIDLGKKEEEGQVYVYRLVYDRPSKNGLCELFVLYRAREGSDNETIVDMYAAEPDSGEVVRSGRKAWSDVGTKAYRDLTGE